MTVIHCPFLANFKINNYQQDYIQTTLTLAAIFYQTML